MIWHYWLLITIVYTARLAAMKEPFTFIIATSNSYLALHDYYLGQNVWQFFHFSFVIILKLITGCLIAVQKHPKEMA